MFNILIINLLLVLENVKHNLGDQKITCEQTFYDGGH